MKRSALLFAFILMTPTANADVYVKVNSDNTVVGGAIVCDADTCGNRESLYSQMTLKEGERYVLQNKTDASGNNWGVGEEPGRVIKVREEADRNTFIVFTPNSVSGFALDKNSEETYTPITDDNFVTAEITCLERDADLVCVKSTPLEPDPIPETWINRWVDRWSMYLNEYL